MAWGDWVTEYVEHNGGAFSLVYVALSEPVHWRAAVDVIEPDACISDVQMAGVLITVLVGVTD